MQTDILHSHGEQEQFARLRLIRSDGIGPIAFEKLLTKHDSAQNALRYMEKAPDRLPKSVTLAKPSDIESEIKAVSTYGAVLLYKGTAAYPALLAEIPDAPPVLTVKGNIQLLYTPCIGVVGARHASATGLKITRQICADLATAHMTIVSGMARGIDTAAHTASLSNGTIACLAGGLDIIYPPENADLHASIGSTGLLVSEMAMGTKPLARHFPRRNRLISGLSQGLLVVEAAAMSGSLITARFAAEQNRDVFAVPGSPLDPRSEGTNALIREGAILTRSAADILAEADLAALHRPKAQVHKIEPARIPPSNNPRLPLPKPSRKSDFLSTLSPTPEHIDEIARATGMNAETLMAELVSLEIQGQIIRHSGNRFSRISLKNE